MMKLRWGAAVVALAFTVAGCSSGTPASTSAGANVTPTPTATAPATAAPTVAAGDPTTDRAAPTTSASAGGGAAIPVVQSTPEAAMTSWLRALVGGDSSNVCGLMAANGTAIADLPSAKEQCAQAVTPMLEQLKSVGDPFKGLTVTGATVRGDTATFESAKTTPAMAAPIIKNLKAVRLGGKWYVTQG